MNWEEYKNKIKAEDPAAARVIEDAELCAPVLSAMIRKREELGMSRRELAKNAACLSHRSAVSNHSRYRRRSIHSSEF